MICSNCEGDALDWLLLLPGLRTPRWVSSLSWFVPQTLPFRPGLRSARTVEVTMEENYSSFSPSMARGTICGEQWIKTATCWISSCRADGTHTQRNAFFGSFSKGCNTFRA